jgi:beta-lactamase regulating signal transducer with metallopeptidase domain
MIAAWMAYAVVVGGCVAIAAAALEPLVASRGRARRAPWLAALLLAVLVPVGVAIRPVATAPLSSGLVVGQVNGSDIETVTTGGRGWSADEILLLLWSGASLAMLVMIAASAWRLHRVAARARPTLMDGEPVALTDDIGPGARGFGTPRILVPVWSVALEPTRRALLVRHEREHVRAGDPRVVLATLAALAAMPWNPALWFVARRLRAALELDCDARVLALGGDVRAYGELLLTVAASRRSPVLSAYLNLASPRSSLERRIRAMTTPPAPLGLARQFSVLLVTCVAAATACETRRPEPLAPVTSYSIEAGKASATAVPSGAAADSARASLAQIIRERVPAAVRAGDPNDPLLLVYDATGALVTARRLPRTTTPPGASPMDDFEYPADAIASVDVNKGGALLPPEARGGVIRIVLKPGAVAGRAGEAGMRPSAAGAAPSTTLRLRGGAVPPVVVVRDSEGRELYREVLATDASAAEGSAFDRVPVSATEIATVEVTKPGAPGDSTARSTVYITLKPGKGLRIKER